MASVALLVVAMLACLIPARRALAVDSISVMRLAGHGRNTPPPVFSKVMEWTDYWSCAERNDSHNRASRLLAL
jgi:hypothetical protein